MTTVTAPVWLLWVLGGLALTGFLAVCWVAASWAERAADWLRARWRDHVTPPLEDDEPDWIAGWWEGDERPQPLAPERTWEQMTSHQLPLLDGTRGLDSAGIVRAHEPWRVEAHLSAERERRPPAYESEARAHYVAMGFDYPSGLMARVRELAP